MRIAYLTADYGTPVFGDKGASIHIHEMVKAFGDCGHELQVLAAQLGNRLVSLPAKVSKIRATPPPLDPAKEPEGVDLRRLYKERSYLRIAERAEEELLALHAARPFDLIYERYSLWSAAGVRAAARLGIPCIVEVNSPLLYEQREYRKLVLADQAAQIEREVFSRADVLAVVSENLCGYVAERGAKRTLVLPNGVDGTRFNPEVAAQRLGKDGNQPFVIGFSGGLKAWHGLRDLCEAFRALCEGDEGYRLLVVGDGPERSWIEGFVRGAGLEDRVTLTGWVDFDALPKHIAAMDLAVAPYPMIEDFYFSPLKLFEYLAMGRTILASDIGQVSEVIEDGKSGLLCSPGNPEALAAGIARLRADPELRRRLAEGARARSKNFTWEGNARRLTQVAQEIKETQRYGGNGIAS
jgi:glycosyltransferase involved in cell wall biosynthesis